MLFYLSETVVGFKEDVHCNDYGPQMRRRCDADANPNSESWARRVTEKQRSDVN